MSRVRPSRKAAARSMSFAYSSCVTAPTQGAEQRPICPSRQARSRLAKTEFSQVLRPKTFCMIWIASRTAVPLG